MTEQAKVTFSPHFSGDGYGYGGGAILILGRFAIPFGEHPEAAVIAKDVANRVNAHEALLKALQGMMVVHGLCHEFPVGMNAEQIDKLERRIDAAHAALALAEGQL